jgi:exonuclease SbcC
MKIISLHFKNLNSLKGAFKIDFTNPELANAGLFAITGPTGAGKSTILDAITLALYSYTPRLEDINDSTIADKGVIVTKHTRDAFSHIEFEVSGERYKAEWAIEQTRNHTWKSVTHKLSIYEVDKFVTIKDKVKETRIEVTKITRLTKDQFTKAIVLSQGKFDEFLKSDKHERYKLLEIITGTDIYRKIGKKIFETLRLKNEEVNKVEAQMGGIDFLTPEQLEALEQNKLALTTDVVKLRLDLNELNDLKLTKEKIKSLNAEKVEIETAFDSLNQRAIEFRPFFKKLEEHRQVLPLQVDYNNWETTAQAIKDFDNQISALNKRLEERLVDKDSILLQFSKIAKVSVDESNFIEQLSIFFNKVNKVDADLFKINTALEQQKEGLNTLFKQIPSSSTEAINPILKSAIKLNDFVNAKDLEINVSPLPIDLNIAQIGTEIENLNSKLSLFQEALRWKTEIIKLEGDKNSNQALLDSLNGILADQEKDLTTNDDHVKALANQVEVVQKAYDANLAYMSLDLHRNKLVEGQACPCCGSLEHPYSKTKPTVNDTLADELKGIKLNLKKAEAIVGEIKESFASNNAKKESIESNLFTISTQLDEKTKLFEIDLTKLGLAVETTLQNLNDSCNAISASINNYKAHKLWNETKQPLLAYIASLEKYNQDESILNSLTAQRKNLFSSDSIGDYKQEQVLYWNNVNNDIATLTSTINDSTLLKEQKQAAYKILNTKLELKVLDLAFESIDTIKLVLLSANDVNTYEAEKEYLNKQNISLTTRSKGVEEQLRLEVLKDDILIEYNALLESITQNTALIDSKNTEIGSIKTKILTNEKNLAILEDLNRRLQALKEEQRYFKIMAEEIGDRDGDKFNNIIQRITLRHLFKMTNDRLSTIMDRYQVDLGTDKYEDEIWVIDTYMGDERRVIDSVSGGERFVISLAMALSLSDLASNNVKLDSVFIDEGFGSLSPEELDNAISMLERMQVENDKTVGIISHVESLKERIGTQIIVEKLQNGESTISLKSNGILKTLAV